MDFMVTLEDLVSRDLISHICMLLNQQNHTKDDDMVLRCLIH